MTGRGVQARSVGQIVGENLRRLRKARGQTQHDAARLLGRKRNYVADLETGQRVTVTADELIQLSRAYDVPLVEWFAGQGKVQFTDGPALDLGAVHAWLAEVGGPGIWSRT